MVFSKSKNPLPLLIGVQMMLLVVVKGDNVARGNPTNDVNIVRPLLDPSLYSIRQIKDNFHNQIFNSKPNRTYLVRGSRQCNSTINLEKKLDMYCPSYSELTIVSYRKPMMILQRKCACKHSCLKKGGSERVAGKCRKNYHYTIVQVFREGQWQDMYEKVYTGCYCDVTKKQLK